MDPSFGRTVVNTGTGEKVNLVDASQMSNQDFLAAVFLERGNLLDTEVRSLVNDIDQANKNLATVNTIIGKANTAEYNTGDYTSNTWFETLHSSGNPSKMIHLENGYVLDIDYQNQKIELNDAEGNKLIYQNNVLIPVSAGTAVEQNSVGIPVMNDMTFVLRDGTEITFNTAPPATPLNSDTLAGGLADIRDIVISRRNQGYEYRGFNADNKDNVGANGFRLNSAATSIDANSNDGYILMEDGGVDSWEYNGVNTKTMTAPSLSDESVTVPAGMNARKAAFGTARTTTEQDYTTPRLTSAERDFLRNVLRVTYDDASGRGHLTLTEWKALREKLDTFRKSLTSNSQLQTVKLQQAMLQYNQNYDALSNAQNKIYSLLRDIMNNVK